MRDLLLLISRSAWGVWRYRWYAAVLAWAICVGGWIYVNQLPDTYTASARLYIDTDSLLKPLLRGLAITANTQRRVDLMTKTLLSRPNLERLARMTDLDISVTSEAQTDRMLSELRSEIGIASDRRSANLYTISYSSDDPQLAKRVVQSLVTILVESALGQGRSDTESAQEFVDRQIASHEQMLIEAEQRLIDFKRNNMGKMPRQGSSYYETMTTMTAELDAARLALDEAIHRRDELERQTEEIEEMGDLETSYSLDEGMLLDPDSSLGGPSQRVRELSVRLDELLLRYTRRHPDVVELERLIAVVEAADRSAPKPQPVDVGANPVRQQMQMLLVEANGQIAALQARVAQLEDRVQVLRERVDTTLEVEKQLTRLDRDYGIIKNNYNQLVSRRAGAQLGEDAEISGGQVSFRTVDPPHVPPVPSGPNRPLLVTMALGAGLAGGIGFAFLLSQFRPTFTDSLLLTQVTELPILGSVSAVALKEFVWRERLRIIGFGATCASLFVTYASVMTLETLGKPWLGRLNGLIGMVL